MPNFEEYPKSTCPSVLGKFKNRPSTKVQLDLIIFHLSRDTVFPIRLHGFRGKTKNRLHKLKQSHRRAFCWLSKIRSIFRRTAKTAPHRLI